MPQPQRPDKLTVSLGVTDPQARRNNLKALALALGFPGRKGDGSISELLAYIADNPDCITAPVSSTAAPDR